MPRKRKHLQVASSEPAIDGTVPDDEGDLEGTEVDAEFEEDDWGPDGGEGEPGPEPEPEEDDGPDEKTTVMRQQEDDRRAAEKARVRSEYDEYVVAVMQLKHMTDTKQWRRYYDMMVTERRWHEVDILTAEKPRVVVSHQEAIKFINAMLTRLKQPVDDLNEFILKMPLFIPDHHTRAAWNPSTGSVDITVV